MTNPKKSLKPATVPAKSAKKPLAVKTAEAKVAVAKAEVKVVAAKEKIKAVDKQIAAAKASTAKPVPKVAKKPAAAVAKLHEAINKTATIKKVPKVHLAPPRAASKAPAKPMDPLARFKNDFSKRMATAQTQAVTETARPSLAQTIYKPEPSVPPSVRKQPALSLPVPGTLSMSDLNLGRVSPLVPVDTGVQSLLRFIKK